MTPAARIAAAIEILDRYLSGAPAEKVLTSWARAHRFAGSGDRAAIRDHVYQAIRCRASYGWLGGGETGRALMIGQARACGWTLGELFSGIAHAPPPLAPGEGGASDLAGAPDPVRHDCQPWVWQRLADHGEDRAPILAAMQSRAAIHLRANLLKTTPARAITALEEEGFAAAPHPLSPTAIEVAAPARGLRQARAFASGLVEFQDAASQAVVDFVRPGPGETVLDYCAGGGGKTLALAALTGVQVCAHDARPARMAGLDARAARAGAAVRVIAQASAITSQFDLVFCDAPCSGSGSWRRDPEGKWALSPERLTALGALQMRILEDAGRHVGPGGRLAYATCSVLGEENAERVAAFLDNNPDWQQGCSKQFTPLDGADGFFVAVMSRRN